MKYTITVFPKRENLLADEGEHLLDVLARHGYSLPAACGGKGTCGKCKVKVLQGDAKDAVPDVNGDILSCKAKVKGDLRIQINEQSSEGLDRCQTVGVEDGQDELGAVLDIGTTTLAACLVSLRTGNILRKTTALTPQSVYGADVLSRIKACQEGKLLVLQKLILDKTEEIITALSQGKTVEELIVSANTTMLHLFLGVDPKTIGVYPFTPVFTNTQRVDGATLGLSAKKTRLLPSASAYIGSDITAGVLFCNMRKNGKTELFVDIGTNGEAVLSHNGKLYATSTAAGPALEGACIECGMGGVSGAVDKVYFKNGKLGFTTIDNVSAKGICGSGLIDLIAVLRKENIIDEGGAWNDESESVLNGKLIDDRFYLTETVYLSQKDIRQFQLAKASISAGLETLIKERGVDAQDVETLYIAGGLGYFMDVDNATAVGLLPKSLAGKAKSVGNTSLLGARLCLTDANAQKEIETIAEETEIIELSFSKIFQELYVSNMSFEM